MNWVYWWSYGLIRWLVYGILVSALGVLVFLGVSSAVVSRRLRKTRGSDRVSVARLNKLVKSGGEGE
jgi:hypothetical protein